MTDKKAESESINHNHRKHGTNHGRESEYTVMELMASKVEELLTVTLDECAKSVHKTSENPMSSTMEQLFKSLGPALGKELKTWQQEQDLQPIRPTDSADSQHHEHKRPD